MMLKEKKTFLLKIVLHDMIPTSRDGRFPSAYTAGIYYDLISEGISEEVDLLLDEMEQISYQDFSCPFDRLSREDRKKMLKKNILLLRRLNETLGMQVLKKYFRNKEVIHALGLPYESPYPHGYQLPENDLSLLAPVQSKSSMFVKI